MPAYTRENKAVLGAEYHIVFSLEDRIIFPIVCRICLAQRFHEPVEMTLNGSHTDIGPSLSDATLEKRIACQMHKERITRTERENLIDCCLLVFDRSFNRTRD